MTASADELRAAAFLLRNPMRGLKIPIDSDLAVLIADFLEIEADVIDDVGRASPDFTDEQLAALVHGPLAIARKVNGTA